MSALFDLLRAATGERSLHGHVGKWRLAVTQALDALLSGGEGYLTQSQWFVNPQTGSNLNDGATAATALQSLAELNRRWMGRTFSPTVSAVAIHLSGSFPTEGFYLNANFTFPNGPVPVTISGTMTIVDSGTVTAYTAWSSATDVRAALTDAAQDFTPHVRRRIRITSGAANGGVAGIGSLGGGATVANVGQFRTGTSFTGANVNPGVGDSYVVEIFDTQIHEYYFDCPGAWIILQDVEVASGSVSSSACVSRQVSQARMKVFGCRFLSTATTQVTYRGDHTFLACMYEGSIAHEFVLGFFNFKAQCVFGSMTVFHAMVQRDSSMHDGNGTSTGHLLIEQATTVFDQTFAAFFNCTNASQTSLVRVNNFANWVLSTAYFWGAAGNLKTNALWVGNGSGVIYSATTVPKATGATPGVNDVVVSNVGAAWATLPILAATPNNGFVNVKF